MISKTAIQATGSGTIQSTGTIELLSTAPDTYLWANPYGGLYQRRRELDRHHHRHGRRQRADRQQRRHHHRRHQR